MNIAIAIIQMIIICSVITICLMTSIDPRTVELETIHFSRVERYLSTSNNGETDSYTVATDNEYNEYPDDDSSAIRDTKEGTD